MKRKYIREQFIIIEENQGKYQNLDQNKEMRQQVVVDGGEKKDNPEYSRYNNIDEKQHQQISNQSKISLHSSSQQKISQHHQQSNYKSNQKLLKPPHSLKTNSISKFDNSYHNLTLKLQKAFNKIINSSKSLNKSAISHINSEFLRRAELSMQKKQRWLRIKTEEKERQMFKDYRDRPSIDKKSDKITKCNGYQPIHIRLQRVLQLKKLKTEYQKELKQEQKIKEQQLIQHSFTQNKYNRQPKTTRTYTQYYTEMIKWKERAQERTQLRMEAQKIKEIQSATFRPNINHKSKTIALQHFRLPIDQRGLIKKKTSFDLNSTYTHNLTHRRACK